MARGSWTRFWRVTVPSIMDVIAITVMLSTIWTFNSFNTVYVLTNGGPGRPHPNPADAGLSNTACSAASSAREPP